LNCWIPKLLSRFPVGAVVDGFAGAGVYTNGEPGSSVVVARTLLNHARLPTLKGQLRVLSLEKRPDRVAELERQMSLQSRHPKLSWRVQPAGELREQRSELDRVARWGDARTPVLWILDPYGPADVPADVVRSCLGAGPRDEVIVTFFSREMYQRRNVPSWQIGLDRHFGNDQWRTSIPLANQREGMEKLVAGYRKTWEDEGYHTAHFSVRVRTESARYYLVFITHSPSGLDCWTKMRRRIDPYLGEGASPVAATSSSLFDSEVSTSRMRAILDSFAGRELAWPDLTLAGWKEGQSERVLRLALSELHSEGLAFRVRPLESNTPWPENCSVRFYSPDSLTEANAVDD
jgi:three-Cys-motif partner protein